MKIVLILMLIPGALSGFSQANFLQNIDSRNTLNLNGRWHYIIDRYETGFRGFQGAKADENMNLSGFFENKQPLNAGELVDYDFEKSPTLLVPADWDSQSAELLFYEGTV